MEDCLIVDLYWARDERAISETQLKYGRMLQSLSETIVNSHEDAQECVNDSYLAAWNSMPENRPDYLGGYMAKITRNISLDMRERKNAQKRRGDMLSFDELEDCIPDGDDVAVWFDNMRIKSILDDFLAKLDTEKRVIFVRRYFYNDRTQDIAKKLGMSDGKIRTILTRLREKLKKRLEDET